MFVWHLDPPADWVADLAAISPPQDHASHLELWWEAGFPWAPAQRWVLYNLIPLTPRSLTQLLDFRDWLDAEGPCTCAYEWRSTAADAYWCGRCQRARSQARQRIWRTFVDRGYYAQPFWVIQGQQGGHPATYTQDESVIAQHHGLPKEPPTTGTLSYAPWDWRVKRHIVTRDLLAKPYASMAAARAHDRDWWAREARVAREQYLDQTFAQIRAESTIDFVDDLPRNPNRRFVDQSAERARFIETGLTQ